MPTRFIPTLDLRTASARRLADALVVNSCVLVVGHGIPLDVRRDVFATGRTFFQLPVQEKEHVRWPGEGIWRGWQPPAAPDIVGRRPPDPVDRYEISDPATFNLWPEKIPALRPAWAAYFKACKDLTSKLMVDLIAALNLPAEFTQAWTTDQFATLLCNYYFEQAEPPAPGQARLAGHSDHGGLTLLAADDAPGGLEVKLPGSDDWLPVIIPEDALLVQAGDLLSRWTNRLMRGNVHRVANPPREAAFTTRMSLVYFHHPSLDTLVEPAPACVATSGRDSLPPLLAGEHCMKRQEAYALAPSARRGNLDSTDGREV